MDNYPLGTWGGDPNAPWNETRKHGRRPIEDEDYDGRFSRMRDERESEGEEE